MAKLERSVEDQFWRNFPAMTDYFSDAIGALQGYLGTSSKELMFQLGQTLGQRTAEKLSSLSMDEFLSELTRIWEEYEIGKLTIEGKDPVVLLVSDCRICGQLPGTGLMYKCVFHEGFFKGALSSKLGIETEVCQETNYEGSAGTWCRRFRIGGSSQSD